MVRNIFKRIKEAITSSSDNPDERRIDDGEGDSGAAAVPVLRQDEQGPLGAKEENTAEVDVIAIPKQDANDELDQQQIENHPLLNHLVFERIFSYLETADLLSCMSTCVAWDAYLKPRRTKFLLKDVMTLSMNQMTKHNFLNARLVSRKWNADITSIYENHPGRLQTRSLVGKLEFSFFDEETNKQVYYCDHGMRFNGQKSQKFLQEMNSHPRNPLLGRAVRLIIQNDYRAEIRPFLERFGDQIWYAMLSFDDEENPDRETDRIENRIRDCLTLLPNLKYLRFDIGGYYDEHEAGFQDRLPEFLRAQPFPRLQHLKTFSYSSISNPAALMNAIVKHSCNPEALTCLDMQFLVFDPAYQFPNLEAIDMRISMGDLTRLKEACPRIKKIRSLLLEGARVDHAPKNLETVFKALEQWKETLKEVELLNGFDFANCSPSYKVDLPNLDVLTIRSCPYGSYDQVPAFQNLKPLVFQNWVKQVEIYRRMDEEFRERLRRVVEGNADVMDLFFRREPIRNN